MDNVDTKVKQIREVEIEILDYVVEICEKNNIEYYLDFGTLLGAIRHEGFIPWDDDIDIAMPRKDYEKFLEICQNIKSPTFFLQTCRTDKEYYQNFAKMRNSDTTFIENNMKHLNFNHGIYIDIFPIDSFPEKSLLQYLKLAVAVSINKMCTLTKNPYAFMPYRIAKIIQLLFKPIKVTAYNGIIDKILRNNKQSKYLYSLENGFDFNKIIQTALLKEKTMHKFEMKEYKIPKNFDDYLKILYGDYMQFPPANERVSPHLAIAVETQVGYKEFIQKHFSYPIKDKALR